MGTREAVNLCSESPLPDTIWKLAVAEVKENHEAILSPDTLQMRRLVGATVQVLWLFLGLNSFVNCTIFSHFGTGCSLLFSVVSSPLWQLPNSSGEATQQHPNSVNQLNRLCDSTPQTHTCKEMFVDADFNWRMPLRKQSIHTREAKSCLVWFWGNNHFIYKVPLLPLPWKAVTIVTR